MRRLSSTSAAATTASSSRETKISWVRSAATGAIASSIGAEVMTLQPPVATGAQVRRTGSPLKGSVVSSRPARPACTDFATLASAAWSALPSSVVSLPSPSSFS
jgi:hypothetical protein